MSAIAAARRCARTNIQTHGHEGDRHPDPPYVVAPRQQPDRQHEDDQHVDVDRRRVLREAVEVLAELGIERVEVLQREQALDDDADESHT